jgi:hypothetical protein
MVETWKVSRDLARALYCTTSVVQKSVRTHLHSAMFMSFRHTFQYSQFLQPPFFVHNTQLQWNLQLLYKTLIPPPARKRSRAITDAEKKAIRD